MRSFFRIFYHVCLVHFHYTCINKTVKFQFFCMKKENYLNIIESFPTQNSVYRVNFRPHFFYPSKLANGFCPVLNSHGHNYVKLKIICDIEIRPVLNLTTDNRAEGKKIKGGKYFPVYSCMQNPMHFHY